MDEKEGESPTPKVSSVPRVKSRTGRWTLGTPKGSLCSQHLGRGKWIWCGSEGGPRSVSPSAVISDVRGPSVRCSLEITQVSISRPEACRGQAREEASQWPSWATGVEGSRQLKGTGYRAAKG